MGCPDAALCGISLCGSCSTTGTNYLERFKEQTPNRVFFTGSKLVQKHDCRPLQMHGLEILRFKCFRLFLLLCHSVMYSIKAASSHRFSLSRRVMKLNIADRCDLTHHKQMRQQEHLKMTQFSQMLQLQK